MTKLIEAVKKNNLLLVKQLLNTEFCLPELINQGDGNNNWTALHYASRWNFTLVVSELVNAGADFNQLEAFGLTALCIAALAGHTETIQVLINAGADVHQLNKHKHTLIFIAAMQGHGDIVKILLAYGANIDGKYGSALSAVNCNNIQN